MKSVESYLFCKIWQPRFLAAYLDVKEPGKIRAWPSFTGLPVTGPQSADSDTFSKKKEDDSNKKNSGRLDFSLCSASNYSN